jgi:putative transposase
MAKKLRECCISATTHSVDCVRVSMDSKGQFLDNVVMERLWRSLKYEEVFIKRVARVLQ